MQTLLRFIYSILVALLIPFVLLRLLWKSRKIVGYRQRIFERFGFFTPPPQQGGLWLHAVSVGESVAAIPIIRQFQKQFPDLPITVTTTTPTGSERVKANFKNEVFNVYFPYDLPGSVHRFLERIRPQIAVILETELWPNVLHVCGEKKIPIVIANGCLSLESFEGYSRVRSFVKEMLSNVTCVAAQSQIDADRFLSLGLEPKQLVVAGNIKYDITVPDTILERGKSLRESIGKDRPVWIAASTHPGEEEQVIAAFKLLKQSMNNSENKNNTANESANNSIQNTLKNPLLILVPRHPNRFQEVHNLLIQQGETVVTRSSGAHLQADTSVFLGDTMGELGIFYAASDIAFVGGSLVAIGGHNILEASNLAKPVIVGPSIENIVEACDKLKAVGGLKAVKDAEELALQLEHWFNNPIDCKKAGLEGQKIVIENRGAVARILSIIHSLIK